MNLKFFKKFLSVNLLFLCALFLFSGQAYALSISPGDASTNGDSEGVSNSQNDINTWLTTNYPALVKLYKDDVDGGESFLLQGSYETTYLNSASDPSGALIEWTGGSIITDAYLLVKDGKHIPYWYLFDLRTTWDGMEDLELSGFWPDKGAISHLTLLGQIGSVPEPATAFLLGIGLIGLATLGRKKIFKK